jgi:ABC-type amino acid transport system permease subunit
MPNFSLQFWHVWPHLDALFQGALLTIALTAQASAFGLVASLVGAYALMSGFKPAATLARAYVEVIRTLPGQSDSQKSKPLSLLWRHRRYATLIRR